MKKKKDKVKLLIDGLASGDEEKIFSALSKTDKTGDERLIYALVDLWVTTKNKEIHKKITEIFYNVKTEKAIVPLIESLSLPQVAPFKAELISAFWNMAPNISEHLNVFVELAVNGNYLESLECLTVIENMEPPFEEATVMDGIITVQEAMDEKDEQKQPFLKEINKILMKLNTTELE